MAKDLEKLEHWESLRVLKNGRSGRVEGNGRWRTVSRGMILVTLILDAFQQLANLLVTPMVRRAVFWGFVTGSIATRTFCTVS